MGCETMIKLSECRRKNLVRAIGMQKWKRILVMGNREEIRESIMMG